MRALLLGITLLAAAPALAAEKYVGSNVDVRTVLAFKVADAAVQKFLPDGWQPDVVTAGPAKDVNLRVTFIDRIVNQDAAGKALEPVRIAHLSIPAKMKGSQTGGTMLFRIYSSSAGGVPGPYGVSVHAPANMERKVRIDPAGIGTVEELWEFKSQDGDSIQLQIEYARGGPRPTRRKQSSIRRPSRNSTASTDPSSPRTWFAARQPTGCRKSCSKPSVRRSRRCSTARSN